MIRELKPDAINTITVSVFLKDGRSFLNRDVPERLFGDVDRIVSFWEGKSIYVFPMRDVDHVELNFKEP